jgi:hypothetical protein
MKINLKWDLVLVPRLEVAIFGVVPIKDKVQKKF